MGKQLELFPNTFVCGELVSVLYDEKNNKKADALIINYDAPLYLVRFRKKVMSQREYWFHENMIERTPDYRHVKRKAYE